MTAMQINGTTVELTKIEARGWEDARTTTVYRVTQDGRELGIVIKYRRSTPILSGMIRVGAHTRWMWKFETNHKIVNAARGTDDRYRMSALRGNYRSPSFTRKEAVTDLLSAVTRLDELA